MGAAPGQRTADWVFHGGTIHTRDGTATAAAVSDGVVTALGDAAVSAVSGVRTEFVDLAGGALLPGFQDAHVHPILGGLRQLSCDLSELHELDAYRDAIAAYARARPSVEWVEGAGWYGDVFAGGSPDRHELDRLVPDRPAVLASHDAHGVWVNSEALRRAGIERHTPDPPGGRIQRDRNGEPTGILVESAADLVTRMVPEAGAAQLEQALRQAQSYLHGLGVTAWQDAAVGHALGIPDSYDLYRRADEEGWLTARVTGASWWYADRGLDQIAALRDRRASTHGSRFRATAVKIMQDGVCENLTAAVLQAYRGHPHEHGLSFIEPAELATVVTALDRERFDVHLHAVGDRAVRECLDAIASARTDFPAPAWGPRHQLAHLDLIDPVDIARMVDLGVLANIQPLWAREDQVLVATKLPYLTEEQRRRHFAFGAMHAQNARLAMGSDWPVSSPDPVWGIHTAVNRTAPVADPHAQDTHAQTVPLLAGQAIPVRAALAAYTSGAAYANRLESTTGSIAVGMAADLVVLDRDPLSVPTEELSSLRVRCTFVDGQVVHSSM